MSRVGQARATGRYADGRFACNAWRGAVLVAATLAYSAPAYAESYGFFDALLGLFRPPHQSEPQTKAALTKPVSQKRKEAALSAPRSDRPASAATLPRAIERGNQISYCVRLCDGRYFPVAPLTSSGPRAAIDVCHALCPASATQIYTGTAIEKAVNRLGQRYSAMPTAFVYRDRIVPGCSCSGDRPTGTASVDIESDPTLRPGDIVVSPQGHEVYLDKRNASPTVPTLPATVASNADRTPR